jgi:predicted enzyme related to lactoylglutathione lyase
MDIDDIEGMITFTYYNDLPAAERFYGEIIGLEKVVDVGFAKVYKAAENAHMGIVDSAQGHLKTAEEKPVMLTFIVEDIEAWHNHLVENGVEITQPPKEPSYLRMKTMLFKDPEGYVVEILEWLKQPYGH